MDQNSVINKHDKNSKKQQQGVDCDLMLNEIKNKIGSIRKVDNNKEPIQLLYDLEQ